MLVGAPRGVTTIAFLPGMDAEVLSEKVKEASRTTESDSGVLILTDIPGGTPTRVAATHAATESFEVVTGVNIPMLAEVFLADPQLTVTALAQIAVRAGRAGVLDVGSQVHNREDKP